MQYSERDLERSKRAYLKGIKKAHRLEKNESKIDNTEMIVWLLFVLFAGVIVFLYGYGEGLAGLILGLVLVSPAIAFSVIRRIIRAIVRSKISHKYKKGALYEKYAVTEITEAYTKAINKVVHKIQQNQEVEKTKELEDIFYKCIEEAVGEHQLSSQKEEELDNDFIKYVHKIEGQLPEEQKKIFKVFLQRVESR